MAVYSAADSKTDAMPSFGLRYRYLLIALVATYTAIALWYSVTTPAWEAPDEPSHFEFVTHLRQTGTLPVQELGRTGASHHPPLYYALVALATLPADLTDSRGALTFNPNFVWAGQGNDPNIAQHRTAETFPYRGHALALHLGRALSVLMGAGVIWLTVLMGWTIFPALPLIGLLAGALVAFNPQFLFISGAINNDNLLGLLATAALLITLRGLADPTRWQRWLWLGVVLTMALLTKTNAIVLCGVVGLAVTVLAIRRRDLRFFWQTALLLGLPVLMGTSWWLWRNVQLYGDLLGWAMFDQIYASAMRQTPLTITDLRHFFTTQMNSFWGLFGWMTVWAPGWFYTAIRVLAWLSVIGFIRFALTRLRELTAWQRGALVLLGGAILAQEAFMLYSITRINEAWYQGRYLFVVITPLMLLMSVGLLHLLPRRWMTATAATVAGSMLAVALSMPLNVIAPAYVPTTLPRHVLWTLPQRTDIIFGDEMVALRGYKVTLDEKTATLDVTLYRQAMRQPDFNYSAFVHLIDSTDEVVAQQDHAPGEGRGYPPTVWQPEDIVADLHRLPLPTSTDLDGYRIRVGLYNWETSVQLPATEKGSPAGTFVILQP